MSQSSPRTPPRRKTVNIVEEVPGVPRAERYFVRYRNKTLHFATAADAKRWCNRRGLPFSVDPFSP